MPEPASAYTVIGGLLLLSGVAWRKRDRVALNSEAPEHFPVDVLRAPGAYDGRSRQNDSIDRWDLGLLVGPESETPTNRRGEFLIIF